MYIASGRAKVWSSVAVIVLMLAPDLLAAGGKGAKGGGGARPAAPRAAYRQATPARNTYRPPQAAYRPAMPRVAAPRRATAQRPPARRPSTNVKRPTPRPAKSVSTANLNRRVVPRSVMLPRTTSASASRRYTNSRGRGYAHRAGIRRTRGYGYSRRYAASNQNTRGVVQRLRATNASLARLDHDYQGHRVRAMRSIQQAIRQLAHTSTTSRRSFANRGGVNGRNRVGLAANRPQPIPQVQSDARMRRAGQTLQGVNVQLTRNSNTPSHTYARRYVQTAMREIGVALRVR